MFTTPGYEPCEGLSAEAGFDRIVICATAGWWTHAAWQLPPGRWASKLGAAEDIEHDTPESLSGDVYGDAHAVMRRQRSP